MVIKGDAGPQEEDNEVFSLRQITSMAELDDLQDQVPDMLLDENENDGDEFKPKYKRYEKGAAVIDDDGAYHDGSDVESDASGSGNESDDSERLGKLGLGLSDDEDQGFDRKTKTGRKIREKGKKKSENPLITDLDTRDKDTKRKQRVQLWFEKDNLKDMKDEDADEDYDLDKLSSQYKQKGVRVLGEERVADMEERFLGKKAKRRARHGKKEESDDDSSSGDSADEAELGVGTSKRVGGSDGYDVVSAKPKKIKLNEEELALGALMVQSNKTRRDLVESAWNRYSFNDDNLPEWFVQDELVNMRKEAPVPKELADEYRRKVEELNVRPIKKVMEAKARKKRRAVKRFEKAKKKAEAVIENADSTAQDKVRQIKK